MPSIAIVGASNDRAKFGNKAVRAFTPPAATRLPRAPDGDAVEGRRAYASLADVPRPVDMVSFYVPPGVGLTLLDAVRDAAPTRFWLNPGSESEALVARARALGLEPMLACSIIAIGESPYSY